MSSITNIPCVRSRMVDDDMTYADWFAKKDALPSLGRPKGHLRMFLDLLNTGMDMSRANVPDWYLFVDTAPKNGILEYASTYTSPVQWLEDMGWVAELRPIFPIMPNNDISHMNQ